MLREGSNILKHLKDENKIIQYNPTHSKVKIIR